MLAWEVLLAVVPTNGAGETAARRRIEPAHVDVSDDGPHLLWSGRDVPGRTEDEEARCHKRGGASFEGDYNHAPASGFHRCWFWADPSKTGSMNVSTSSTCSSRFCLQRSSTFSFLLQAAHFACPIEL